MYERERLANPASNRLTPPFRPFAIKLNAYFLQTAACLRRLRAATNRLAMCAHNRAISMLLFNDGRKALVKHGWTTSMLGLIFAGDNGQVDHPSPAFLTHNCGLGNAVP